MTDRFCLQIIIFIVHISLISGTWWYFSQLPVQALGLVGPPICDNIPGLYNGQRKLCRTQPDAMLSVARGAKLGVRECQWQFRKHRWNCSTHNKDSTVFGRAAHKGNKEAAFVHAVSSAGVVHAMTRSCSRGELNKCACDPQRHGKGQDKRGEFQWGGCSDNVRYACRFARLFVDAREKRQRDIRARMNLHNNRAGRRAVKRFSKLQCKCHGVSGSCSTRTCWSTLHEFRKVGTFLKNLYSQAVHVTMDQDGHGLLTIESSENSRRRPPNRNHLVFYELSPNYCLSDPHLGSPGTVGRECNVTSQGQDNCDTMCCGRGYEKKTVRRQSKCDCKFQWCCQVRCRDCDEWVDLHTCRGPDVTSQATISKTNSQASKVAAASVAASVSSSEHHQN